MRTWHVFSLNHDNQRVHSRQSDTRYIPWRHHITIIYITEKDRNQKLNHHTAGIISCILAAIDCNNIHGGDIYVGFLAGIWPCGMITMLSELYIAESKTQVYAALHDYLSRNSSIFLELSEFIALVHCMIYYIIFTFHFNVVKNIGYICYDDGCHLRRFAQQPHRKNVTATSQKLASLEIVVDKMHIAGHKDPCTAKTSWLF